MKMIIENGYATYFSNNSKIEFKYINGIMQRKAIERFNWKKNRI